MQLNRSTTSVTGLAFSLLVMLLTGVSLAIGATPTGWQATSTVVNGVPLEIRSSIVKASAEDIERSIRHSWEAGGSETRRFELPGGRTVLGRIKGSKHETVMLRAGPQPGTTELHVSVTDLDQTLQRPAMPPFKLPPGMRVGQAMEFKDSDQIKVSTFQLSTPARVAFAAAAVLKSMQLAQWQLQHEFTYGVVASEEARALMAVRDRDQMSIMVVPAERGSSVWVILEEAGR